MKILSFFILNIYLFAQVKTNFLYEFGNFSNASSFTISSNGFIYVTDIGRNEIKSFDTLGNQLKDIGGFGWQSGLFDQPVDVFANPLSVFVADKNNHRIQQFDRNLNIVGAFSNRNDENPEYSFGFPLSVTISNQGDMFILDGENFRALKFDMFGNFLTSFAGIDAGRFRILRPSSMAIDSRGLIFIADEKAIKIYDSFGNGLNKIDLKHKIKNIRILFDEYTIVTNDSIYKLFIDNDSINIIPIEISLNEISDIKSAFIFNNKLYLLLFNKIQVFSLEP